MEKARIPKQYSPFFGLDLSRPGFQHVENHDTGLGLVLCAMGDAA